MRGRSSHEQVIAQGQAGVVTTYLPVVARSPVSATVRFETPARDMPVAPDVATVDPFLVQLSAAASAGDTRLSIFAGPGDQVAGRLYVLSTAGGVPVLVECAKSRLTTDDDDTFHLREPLPRAFALDQTTIAGAAITFALTASDTADVGRCRAVVDATVDDIAYSWAVDFRISPRLVAYQLTRGEGTRLSPYAARLWPPNDVDGDEMIGAAWDRFCVPVMLGRGIRPERIVSWEQVRPWHIAALEHLLAEAFEQDSVVREEKRLALRAAETLALASITFWVDDSDSLSPPAETPGAWGSSFVTR